MQYYTKEMVRKYSLDPFDLLSDSQQLVHQQLSKLLYEKNKNYHIDCLLDVAVGLGHSLMLADQHFNVKKFIGNDYSQSMLDHAQDNFPNFIPIHGDALDIAQHVDAESVDVVYSHYVLSYVDADILLNEIYKVLKPGGCISLATSTWDNLRSFQDLMEQTLPFLFNRDKAIKRYKGMIPLNGEQVCSMLSRAGFENIQLDYVQKDITFHNFNEFWAYFAEAGWHVQASRITGKLAIDKTLWRILARILSLFSRRLRYPLSSTTNLCVLVAQKPSDH